MLMWNGRFPVFCYGVAFLGIFILSSVAAIADDGLVLEIVCNLKTGYATGATFADLDSDGVLDIITSGSGVVASLSGLNLKSAQRAIHSLQQNIGTVPAIADVNNDGIVNIDDIFFVQAHWGESVGPADVNDDGVVDIEDIFFVLAHWT